MRVKDFVNITLHKFLSCIILAGHHCSGPVYEIKAEMLNIKLGPICL